jgi:hypothetical protein
MGVSAAWAIPTPNAEICWHNLFGNQTASLASQVTR